MRNYWDSSTKGDTSFFFSLVSSMAETYYNNFFQGKPHVKLNNRNQEPSADHRSKVSGQ